MFVFFSVLASPVSSTSSSPSSNTSPSTTTKVEQGSLVQVKTEISNDAEQHNKPQSQPQQQQQVITLNGQQVVVSLKLGYGKHLISTMPFFL